ncbi:MAG: transporter substrate-binding domain-containing protein [Christensenellaceae bacterium]|nr:transporter substrate-binding domain-containing protein [Christensenellaceae bacterium]
MKKLLAILLVVMMLFAFAACAPKEAPAADVPVADEPAKDAPADEPAKDAPADAPAEENDWDYIANKGEMIIGITYFEPMNYFDENGELIGFETEFAKAVCEELGITPNFIEINWDTKEVELAAKTIDAVWNGCTITEDRKENMDFSVPYIKNKQVCIIKASNAEKYTDLASMADANFVAEVGSAGESAIAAEEALANVNYTPVQYQSNALMEIKAGTADVTVIDYVMAMGMVGPGTDYEDLMIVDGIELTVEEYGIGFRKGSDATLEMVNAAIEKLAQDGTLNEIAKKYELEASLIFNQ